jgi:hypothetical protein
MAETSTPVRASGTTDATCREAGPYRSSRNAKVAVFLKPGDRFPVDTDGARTTWTLVSEADALPTEES